jgi:DNA-binding CsgD family transcriptional regulator
MIRSQPVGKTDPAAVRRRGAAGSDTAASGTADAALRESGIRVIGRVPWGMHVCVFYETREDLLDTAVSYFRAGLDSDEFCVWAVSDPITVRDARNAIRREIPGGARHLASGRIEILQGTDWYLEGDRLDLQRVTGGWKEKLSGALGKGYAGMRVSGNAFWIATEHWQEFCKYEEELDRSLAGQKMLVMCTYSLRASKAVDVLDVARAHQRSIARRRGHWEFLETPELRQANEEIRKLNGALDIMSAPFPGHDRLTPRERTALAQIVRGASNKEAGRLLGISPRTVEYHRANIMEKLGARNTADLVRRVLAE